MKLTSAQIRVLIFAGLALLALTLLASSLNTLSLQPGQNFSFEQAKPNVVDESVSDDWLRTLKAILRIILILGWIVLPLYIVLLIVSKEARKKLLRDLAIVAPLLVLLYFYTANMKAQNGQDQGMNIGGFATPDLSNSQGTAVPPPTFTGPSDWVTTVTTVVIALSAALIISGILFAIWRRSRLQPVDVLAAVEQQAQDAIASIEAGGDLRGVIMRCYYQMVEAIKEYRGIQRSENMTPHEFLLVLEARGLPAKPIQDLTELFEQVRYGDITPARQEERTAIASLSAIVSACQKARVA